MKHQIPMHPDRYDSIEVYLLKVGRLTHRHPVWRQLTPIEWQAEVQSRRSADYRTGAKLRNLRSSEVEPFHLYDQRTAP